MNEPPFLVLNYRYVRPVEYSERPGGQHVFDLFHSVRFEAAVDRIETFARPVVGRRAAT